uniref:Uncharacterized protein n=1 Tax=Aegilops tauschii subsp. strangulata TaxID=200361 RepID=A0A453KQP5_AEGTS
LQNVFIDAISFSQFVSHLSYVIARTENEAISKFCLACRAYFQFMLLPLISMPHVLTFCIILAVYF